MYPDMQSYCTSFDRFSKISFYGMKQPLSDLLDDGLVRNGIIVSNHYQPGYYVDPENPDNIDLVKGVIRRQASEQGLTEFVVKTVDAGTFRKGATPLKTGDRYYDTTGIVYYRDLFDRTEPRATRLREEAKAEAEKQERMEKAQTEHSKDLESAKQEISAYCIKLGGPDAWCTAQADRLIAEGLDSEWSAKFLTDLETGNLDIPSNVPVTVDTVVSKPSNKAVMAGIGVLGVLAVGVVVFSILKKKPDH